MQDKRKKDKAIGLGISIGIHSAILLLFFFMMAWKRPDPPQEEYGIELNFGLTESGSGAVQPKVQEVQDEPSEPTEEITEDVVEEVQESAPEPTPTPTEEPVVSEDPVTTTENDLPSVEPEKAKPKPKERKPDPQSLFPTSSNKTNGAKSDENNESSSQGDKSNKGDQGIKEGDVEEKALYGQHGGGDGASLDMLNWYWDTEPKVNDTSNESGRITFQIKIDENGELLSVKTLQSTVSPGVERTYRNAVYKLTFSPTNNAINPSAGASGKITFIIRSN